MANLLVLALECAHVVKWTPTCIHLSYSGVHNLYEPTFGAKCAHYLIVK